MINKENILFGVVGLLAGLIVGFMFANSVNQGAGGGNAGTFAANTMPAGHPPVPGSEAPGGQGMQNVPEVQAAIDKARAEPNNFDAQLKAAEFYYQIQRFEGALEFLKQANKLQPDNYDVQVHMGNAYFDSGKYDEAEKWYNTALAKKPDDVSVRTDLGLTYIFRENPDYDRAIKEFTTSLEKEPNHPQTLQNLVVAYTKKKDTAKANETLAQLEAMDPTNTTIAKLREEIQALGK